MSPPYQGREPVLSAKLLDWYDRNRRDLPWRAPPGKRVDPYAVWLSEIMLQQTTVAAVGPYFRSFLARWPTVADLAAAELDDVLRAWAGLGYYARARNLHRCAVVVARDHGGRFPDSEEELRRLPGIGAYTAAAVAAIAFDRPAAAVDGNVERVLARMAMIDTPLPAAKPAIQALAARLVPTRRAGDYTQALFDLGATICTPRKPRCLLCPWAEACGARAAGREEALPVKGMKPAQPLRYGVAFLVRDGRGHILLRRRADDGLLGGMMELPSTDWTEHAPDAASIRAAAPVSAVWTPLQGVVRHTFTHFRLELSVLAGRVDGSGVGGIWVPPERLEDEALPTVMRKLVRHGLDPANAPDPEGPEAS